MNYAYRENGVSWRWPYIDVLRVEFDDCYLNIYAIICDRDTATQITQRFVCSLPPEYKHTEASPEATAAIIRSGFLMLVNHELDELLRVDDTWQDPHTVQSP